MENSLLEYSSMIITLVTLGIVICLVIMFAQSYKEKEKEGVQENRESLEVVVNETNSESDTVEPRTVENPIQRTVHENTIDETQIAVENEGIYSDGIVYGGLIIGFIILVSVVYIYVRKKINGVETKIDKIIKE